MSASQERQPTLISVLAPYLRPEIRVNPLPITNWDHTTHIEVQTDPISFDNGELPVTIPCVGGPASYRYVAGLGE